METSGRAAGQNGRTKIGRRTKRFEEGGGRGFLRFSRSANSSQAGLSQNGYGMTGLSHNDDGLHFGNHLIFRVERLKKQLKGLGTPMSLAGLVGTHISRAPDVLRQYSARPRTSMMRAGGAKGGCGGEAPRQIQPVYGFSGPYMGCRGPYTGFQGS